MSLLFIQRRQTPSPWRGESVSLLHRDKANPFSIKRRERLASLQRGGQALLYEEERVSLLFIYIYIYGEADSLSLQRLQRLPFLY